MNNTITSIQIQIETRELLKKLGHKGESYDGLVRRLVQGRLEDKQGDIS
jgi:hypothetical protein